MFQFKAVFKGLTANVTTTSSIGPRIVILYNIKASPMFIAVVSPRVWMLRLIRQCPLITVIQTMLLEVTWLGE